MRPRQYTRKRRTVHVYAASLCQQHLRLADHGRTGKAHILWAVLFGAAARRRSLAAACASRRDALSDTAAHDALLATLPDFAERPRRRNRALQGNLSKALRMRIQPLAIDLKLVPYHGSPCTTPRKSNAPKPRTAPATTTPTSSARANASP